MPRRPEVRYFASREAYYCQHKGKQHCLAKGPDDAPNGPTYQAALKAFMRLWELGNVEQAGETNTLRALCETYHARTAQTIAAGTQRNRLNLLRPFIEAHGNLHVSQLTEFKVEGFLADMRRPREVRTGPGERRSRYLVSWGESRIATFIVQLSAALNWAVKRKLIPSNPIQGMRIPQMRSRGREAVLTPEEQQRIRSAIRSAAARRVILALEDTGARPSEIVAATAANWDDNRGALVYYADVRRGDGDFRHKTAETKDRVIYFTGEALAMMRDLVRRYPRGPLFRTSKGNPYSYENVNAYFQQLRIRVGLPHLTAYSYRHTFATRWLMSGRSIELLAELLGNTPETIRKHYAHLCADWQTLRRHLEDLKRGEGRNDTPAS